MHQGRSDSSPGTPRFCHVRGVCWRETPTPLYATKIRWYLRAGTRTSSANAPRTRRRFRQFFSTWYLWKHEEKRRRGKEKGEKREKEEEEERGGIGDQLHDFFNHFFQDFERSFISDIVPGYKSARVPVGYFATTSPQNFHLTPPRRAAARAATVRVVARLAAVRAAARAAATLFGAFDPPRPLPPAACFAALAFFLPFLRRFFAREQRGGGAQNAACGTDASAMFNGIGSHASVKPKGDRFRVGPIADGGDEG